MRAIVGIVVASLASGCSFYGVPKAVPGAPCKESSVLPVLDSFGALGFAIPGGVIVWAGATGGEHEAAPPAAAVAGFGVLLLIPATVYAISAVRGFRRTYQCQDLHSGAQ